MYKDRFTKHAHPSFSYNNEFIQILIFMNFKVTVPKDLLNTYLYDL